MTSICGKFSEELLKTARGMTVPGKGLLAADESTGTIGRRFDGIGVENTEANRQAYRQLLFKTADFDHYINSGIIMYEETLFQKTDEGEFFTDYVAKKGVIPGIKVDLGKKALLRIPFLKMLDKYKGDLLRSFEESEFLPKSLRKTTHFIKKHIKMLFRNQSKPPDLFFSSEKSRRIKREKKMTKKQIRWLDKNGIRFGDLEILKRLGKGSEACTYLCMIKKRKKIPRYMRGFFVVKIFKDEMLSREEEDHKTRIEGTSLFHKNLVPILFSKLHDPTIDMKKLPDYKTFWKKSSRVPGNALILMKYHNKDLNQMMKDRKIKGFKPIEVARIMKCVLEGANHMHRGRKVHRDIHTGNIFIDEKFGRAWIGDYGCVLDLNKSEIKSGFKVPRDSGLIRFEWGSSIDYNLGGDDNARPKEIDDSEDILDFQKSDCYAIGVILKKLMKMTTGNYFDELCKKMTHDDIKMRCGLGEAISKINGCMESIIKDM